MAIVNMNKISIVGLEAEKDHILKFLMKKGFVQIDDSACLADDENYGDAFEKDSRESSVLDYEQRMSAVSVAMDTLKRNVKIKKPMLAPKPDFKNIDSDYAENLFKNVLDINSMSKEINALKSEENSVTNNRNTLLPWKKFDVKLNELSTKYTKTILGTLPLSSNIDDIVTNISTDIPECIIVNVETDKQFRYVYITAHKSVFDDAMEAVRVYGFSPVTFGDFKDIPEIEIKNCESKIKEINDEKQKLTERIKSFGDKMGEFENLYDYYMVLKDENKIVENFVKTKTTFCMTGWLPSDKSDSLVKTLTESYGCYVETEKGNPKEGYPVLLKNNSVVTPFEDITNMYSTPSTRDVDPSGIMAFFYIIFFGMMLADAGYGILIALACFVIVKKTKLKKGQGNLIKLMGICGISTAVWGFIFGSVFGSSLPGIPVIINPLEDVMTLMAMSLVFGIIHIYIGLGIKGYTLLRDGDVIGFFSDIILWYIFITGVCLLIIPVVAGDIGVFFVIGKYLAIIGMVGIILTNGRAYKGIFMKLFKGTSALYGITGYFGDILSYTRLMALCLSSGVIGQVINLLGAMAGPVGMIIIGLIGHSINLFIGALGAYVHTSRLQFVEFFGKFYEGGGEAFTPFKFRTKYTSINEEEM